MNPQLPTYNSQSICTPALCTGCAACANVCPVSSITMQPDAEGFLRPQIDEARCTHCHLCEKCCPVNVSLNAQPSTPNHTPLAVYAAQAKDLPIRLASSSGDIFTLLARQILAKGKFPAGYVVELSKDEAKVLRSKILTLENESGKGHHSKHGYKVFSERGLYMLATILKGERAVRTTLSIIDTYAQVRSMVRDMAALQTLKDGSPEQAKALTQAGHKLADIIGENLTTDST